MDEQTNEQAPRVRILRNGAVYDMQEKRIVAAPPKDKQPINQENASAMAKSRWDKHRAAVIAGALDAVAETRKIPRGEAERLGFQRPIARAQAKLALSGGRESTRAAEFVFSHAGFPAGGEAQAEGGVRLEVWGDALERVLAVLRRGAADDSE